jgi:DNA-binding NarL/FixJ family response regulator
MPTKQSGARTEKGWLEGGREAVQVVVVASALAMRAGLRALLGAGGEVEVIGEAATLAELSTLPPDTDVLVVAVGAAASPELKKVLSSAEPIAVLLLVEDEPAAARLLPELTRRAWGILSLETSAEELAAAVHALSEGLLVGAPALVEPLLVNLPAIRGVGEQPLVEPLTERELEVLQRLAQGLANKQIAALLGISEHTVKFHVSAIYSKLGATNRTEAVRLGVHQGLVVL